MRGRDVPPPPEGHRNGEGGGGGRLRLCNFLCLNTPLRRACVQRQGKVSDSRPAPPWARGHGRSAGLSAAGRGAGRAAAVPGRRRINKVPPTSPVAAFYSWWVFLQVTSPSCLTSSQTQIKIPSTGVCPAIRCGNRLFALCGERLEVLTGKRASSFIVEPVKRAKVMP